MAYIEVCPSQTKNKIFLYSDEEGLQKLPMADHVTNFQTGTYLVEVPRTKVNLVALRLMGIELDDLMCGVVD